MQLNKEEKDSQSKHMSRVPGRMGAGMEATRGLRLGRARRFREVGKLEEVEWGLRAKAGASRVRLSLSAKTYELDGQGCVQGLKGDLVSQVPYKSGEER